jgi:hypothetical protein
MKICPGTLSAHEKLSKARFAKQNANVACHVEATWDPELGMLCHLDLRTLMLCHLGAQNFISDIVIMF